MRILQLADPNYKFSFVLIIIGVYGTVLTDLHKKIRQLDFNKQRVK